jgi:hypothetical protein
MGGYIPISDATAVFVIVSSICAAALFIEFLRRDNDDL